jgi:hypothetical protein
VVAGSDGVVAGSNGVVWSSGRGASRRTQGQRGNQGGQKQSNPFHVVSSVALERWIADSDDF